MPRELIEIEPTGNGWIVRGGASVRNWPTKAGAIDEGHRLTERRHSETGQPTALKVPVDWGEAILVSAYGRSSRPMLRVVRRSIVRMRGRSTRIVSG